MNKILFAFKKVFAKKRGSLGENWNFVSNGSILSSPVVLDIDGDGQEEIVFGTKNGEIHCLDLTGRSKWSFQVQEHLSDVELMFLDADGMNTIHAPPNIDDINNDSHREVVFGSELGFVYAVDHHGKLIWKYRAEGPVRASPLLVDLNNDGRKEVVFGCLDKNLYVLSHDGKLLWKHAVDTPIESTPAALLKGSPQIVFGSDDGIIHSIDFKGQQVWSYQTRGKITAQPEIADLLGNQQELIIVGSFDNYLYAFNHEGNLVWSFPTNGPIVSKVCVADINNDRRKEVLFGSCDNKIYALKPNGDKLWEYETDFWVVATPIVADVDGDGKPEVVAGSYDHSLYVLDAEGSYILDYVPGLSGVVPQAGHYNEIMTKAPGVLHGKKLWQYEADGIIVGCAVVPQNRNIIINTKVGKVNDIAHKVM